MNIAELNAKLATSKLPPESYCLTGGLPNEALCIERGAGKWYTYYSERGQRTDLESFDTEEAACDDFYERILTHL